MKPVYMINGFLESGKSEFINYTLSQPYFQSKGPTMLLLCEEGEVEFEETLLKKTNTILIPIRLKRRRILIPLFFWNLNRNLNQNASS